ncbi:MAG: RagB/SusD family nutrient uptake outer membrane protein [Bacteroidaceae bacterium]|nr:RagB/SusD family nutrient uptake outer membrane protein [Bacteroidaceae bacterium]
MKKFFKYILALAVTTSLFTACVDDINVGNAFLEKAPGVDVNIDTVFSKAEYTRNFLWSAYGQIYCTYTSGNMMNGAPIDVLSDSYHCYVSWGGPKQSYYPGLLTEDAQDTDDGNLQGKFSYSTKGSPSDPDGQGLNSDAGGRVSIYETVRKCWQLIENIDRVPDMSDAEKSRLRGEAYTIMASRYFDAFRNFGGLCLVKKAYEVGEGFTGGRSTAMQTVEFIDSLIQCAINEPGYIWNVPDADVGQWSGRLTKASARALRAKVWMFAASPLFNNEQPYLTYTKKPTGFENDLHVWFGKADPTLWNRCLQYCNDFFADNEAHGNYYQLIQPATQDEGGYRMAYRRAYRYRNNETRHEKIFDAHPTQYFSDEVVNGERQNSWGWGWKGFAIDCYRQGGAVPTNELMECFGMADGRNFPYADIYGPGKNPNGIDMFADRDPRLYETMVVPRQSFPSAVVGDYNGFTYIDTWYHGAMRTAPEQFGAEGNDDVASGYRKFKWMLDYSNDKLNDEYIGISYIRLAEMYLIRAEAKAETGDLAGALDDLHVVRSRVGLGRIETMNPGLNLTTNKENLIDEILRERNCEIGAECGDRLYDMVRRKRQDLFTKPLHEIVIYRLDANGNRMGKDADGNDVDTNWDPSTPWPKFEYEKPQIVNGARIWWTKWDNKWYLDPVSRDEIQKGYGLTQNPGW